MGETTGISWCDHTFNPWWGCQRVSPGCEHCYAETLSARYGSDIWGPAKTTARRLFGAKHWAEPLAWNKRAQIAGVRRRVFCASMADVFEDHPDVLDHRERLWELIEATQSLDWLLLTKRPENMMRMLPEDWLLEGTDCGRNVWLGTSVEDQQRADERIPLLLQTPAAVRFLSVEPLLGTVDLRLWRQGHFNGERALHWAIIGGESGPGYRQMELAWLESIVVQCKAAGVSVFVKQDSGPRSGSWGRIPERLRIREFPTKEAA